MTVTINGTTGYSGPVGTIGDLTTTGNTTLGDASSDTLTINGSTTTLTQGTANGVAYLNGSKVLTTGSVLTFDGSTFGLGVTAAGAYVNSTGQGTSSLWMAGTSGSASLTQFGGELRFNTGGTANTAATGATEKMRLDSSGNLGLGVTPSAWFNEVSPALQIYRCTIGQNTGFDVTSFSTNAYYSAANTWRYIGSAAATKYDQYSGSHRFYISNSGTAGNAITFTQAMTLDASGNLGVGTSSPGSYMSGTAKLVAYANANSQNNILVRNDSNGASSSSAIALNASGNTWGIEIGSATKNNNALTFQLDYGGANSTKMTIDSSGRMTTPYQTGFGAHGTSGNWSVPTGGGIVPYDTATYNTGSNYNASTYTFTAPVAGKYFVSFSALIYPNSIPTGTFLTMFASVNGATTYSGAIPMARMSFKENQTTMGSYGVLSLSANDTVAIRAEASGSSSLTLYLSSGHASFFVYLLG